MNFRNVFATLAVAISIGKAGAIGTLIPAGSPKDMVYDAKRDLVYITNSNQVLRYRVSTASFLPPIKLGSLLVGIDLSPDGKTLAVADAAYTSKFRWVHLVDTDTLVDNKQSFETTVNGEAGTFAVAYAFNGDLFVTGSYAGSGPAPMRRLTASTGEWSIPFTPNQNTMVSASGDGKVIAFAEGNISDGRWGRIDVVSGQIVRRQGTNGTSNGNYEMATSATGSQYLINGTYLYNHAYTKIATMNQLAGAYHPVQSKAYIPIANTSQVGIFNMSTFQQTGTLEFEQAVSNGSLGAFLAGRTKLSRDGSLLMVIVSGGVHILRMYAPLSASNVSASMIAGQPIAIPVNASLGNGGAINYGIAQQPSHGVASVNGSSVTYIPNDGFVGDDVFNYQARYGQAVATGTITVSVSPNQQPIAVADSVHFHNSEAALIPVLANDSDPDGQALAIIMVTQPEKGTVAIQGNQILYTPQPGLNTVQSFSYTISDGHGGSAMANVTVRVTN